MGTNEDLDEELDEDDHDSGYGDDDDEDSPPIDFAERDIVFHEADPRKGFVRNPSKRFISLELEMSGTQGNRWARRTEHECERGSHSVKHDGSLPDTGFEICTSPAQGDEFVKRIEGLCQALSYDGARVDGSCGMHVHVDARDFSHWEVQRLCVVYSRMEDALFQVVSPSRDGNEFCHRCGEKLAAWERRLQKDARSTLHELLYGYDKSELKGAKGVRRIRSIKRDSHGSGKRYWALNLHSWMHRGTIECRMHQGTTNAEKAVNWGILWAGILDFVHRSTDRSLKKLPTDPWECLMRVSLTEEVSAWLAKRRKEFGR